MNDYTLNAYRAYRLASDARDADRWSVPATWADVPGAHTWSDGGGAYSLVTDENGVPVAHCVDGDVYPWSAREITLDADLLALTVREYPMTERVAGIPCADIGMDGDYLWIIDGRAFVADEGAMQDIPAPYSVYTLSDGIADDYDVSPDASFDSAYAVFVSACRDACVDSEGFDTEISVHMYDPHNGSMIAETVYRGGRAL